MKIKYINGFKIRNTIDPDFGVIGSSKFFNYIPKNEIWFDKRYKKEEKHFLKIHLCEIKLAKKSPYEKARKIIQKRFMQKTKDKKIPNFRVKKSKYNGYTISYVDGKIIRKYVDPKFILGMHCFVKRNYEKLFFKNQIWIDILQDKREYKFTLIHEYNEAELMKKGMNYNDAHDFSLAIEKIARRKDGCGKYSRD